MHNRRPLCTRVQKVLISSRYYIIFSLLKCEIFKTEREGECLNVGMLECLNVGMLECWNGGLEGLGGLESLEFRVGSLGFRVLSSLPLTTKH